MKLITIAVCIFFCSQPKAQINIINQSLTDSSVNVLYIGIENRIKITGCNAPYTLAISGAGGRIAKKEKNEYTIYVVTPTKLCELILLSGTKHIFRKSYEARKGGDPVAYVIGGLKDTSVKKNTVTGQSISSCSYTGVLFDFIRGPLFPSEFYYWYRYYYH